MVYYKNSFRCKVRGVGEKMSTILTIGGIFLTAILTYYANYKNIQKSNEYNSEREYIDKVCVTIIQYIENMGKKHDLKAEDIKDAVDFMEKIYSTYYMYIKDKDRKALDRLANSIDGDFNTMVQNYVTLMEYFNNIVREYKKRNEKEKVNYKIIIEQTFSLVIMQLVTSASLAMVMIGICGIYVRKIGIELKNWSFDKMGEFKFSFPDKSYPKLFLGLGIFLFIYCVALEVCLIYNKQNK